MNTPKYLNPMKRRRIFWLINVAIAVLLLLVSIERSNAQCGASVPTFTVDLTGNPDSIWLSSSVARVDQCCGVANNVNCIRFIVTLDSNAVGINLDIFSGAVPGGALFWQVSCTGSNAVGADICLNGPGPHDITFCKPGNNVNVYSIASIPSPSVSDPITVSGACVDKIFAKGLIEDSIVWRSIPNNPTYNNFLSDTIGEDTVTVTPSGSYPTFVDYEVSGPVKGACGSSFFRDTIRVTFVQDFSVRILPDDPSICFGGAPVQIYAQGSGGSPPYSFTWNTGETTDTINANLGTYSVIATDSLGCSTVYDTIFVDSFAVAISANAGNDTFLCGNQSSIDLVGLVTGASGGTWYNGGGTYTPSTDSLNLTYTPSSAELLVGEAVLNLRTTGNKTCPGDTDTVIVKLYENPVPIIQGSDTACQYETSVFVHPSPGSNILVWTIPGGTLTSGVNDNPAHVVWNDTGYQIVQLRIFDPVSSCDSTLFDTIYVSMSPLETITGNDTACQFEPQDYSVTLNAGFQYVWIATGGSIIGSNTNNSVTIRWDDTGFVSAMVRITNTMGCDTTAEIAVYSSIKPKPVIALPNDTACENKIYNYSITPAAGESFAWTVTGGAIIGDSTGDNINVLWAGPGTGTVTVTKTSAFGCDSSVTESVTIVQTPKPVINLPNDSACQNKIATYSVTAVAGESYVWTVSGGQIIGDSTSNSVNVLWGAPGTGTLGVTQTSSFGCDSTVTEAITLISSPAPIISGPDTVCENKIYPYSVSPIIGHTYSWSVSGGSIVNGGNSTTVNILWAGPGRGAVSVLQVSPFGCDSLMTDSVDILRTPMPVIQGEDTVCQDKVMAYHIDSFTTDAYQWSVSGGSIVGNSNDTFVLIKWGTAGLGTVTLQQTSSLGCDSVVSISILIQPTPQPIMQGDTNPCRDKVYTYQVLPEANHQYVWTVNGGHFFGDSTQETVLVVWDSLNWGTISLTMISPQGCDSTIMDSVFIRPTPRAAIIGNDTSCQNDVQTYHVEYDPTWTYSWSANGGQIIGSASLDSVSVLWTTPGTGMLTIGIFNTAGCDTILSAYPVTVLDKPTPVINGQGPVCRYKTYLYSTTPTPGETYAWSVIGGYIIGDTTSTNIAVLWDSAASNSITLHIMNDLGCDSTVTRPIQVSPTPVPAIDGPGMPCENELYYYYTYASNIGQLSSGMNYLWSVNGGNIIGPNDRDSVRIQWIGSGLADVTLRMETLAGCDSTITFNVNVQSAPVPVINGPDTVCNNRIAQYNAQAIAGHRYRWTVTNGTILGSDTNTFIQVLWGTPGAGTIELYQLNGEGCDSSVVRTIALPPSPNPIISGDTPVCAYSVHPYTVTNLPGHSYEWSVIGGTFLGPNTGSGVTIAWEQAGIGRLTVKQTSNVGCDSTIELDIRINPRPKAVIRGEAFACSNTQGKPFYQEDYQVPPKPNVRYDWTVTGGSIVGNTNSDSVVIKWGISGTHPIYLRATDTITGCFMEDTFYVQVGTIQAPTILSSSIAGCIPLTITLNNATAGDSLDYRWDILGVNVPAQFIPNPTFIITSPGVDTARVIVRNKYGCTDTAYQIIVAEDKPIADFEVINADDLFLGDTAYFDNLTTGATDYEWTFHDGDMSFDFEPEKYYPQPGSYRVQLVAITGIGKCPDTVVKTVTIHVEPDILVPNAFTPNGDINNEYFTVDLYYILEMEIIIFNRWGEIIFQSTDMNFKWDATYKGVPVQEDVYAYYIRARGFNNELVVRKGNVAVIR